MLHGGTHRVDDRSIYGTVEVNLSGYAAHEVCASGTTSSATGCLRPKIT
jgi:hypothetical protein